MSSDDLDTGPSLLAPGAREPSGRGMRVARLLFIPLLLILLVVVLVFYVFWAPLTVDGPSMEPMLHTGDRLLVTRGYRTPHRGDIVEIRWNQGGQATELIKRVVALPGDTVEIRADVAWVNGVREPARGQFVERPYAVNVAPYVVPRGYLYLMGDNRAVSEDSRYIGPLPLSEASGKAVALFAPITRMRLIP